MLIMSEHTVSKQHVVDVRRVETDKFMLVLPTPNNLPKSDTL